MRRKNVMFYTSHRLTTSLAQHIWSISDEDLSSFDWANCSWITCIDVQTLFLTILRSFFLLLSLPSFFYPLLLVLLLPMIMIMMMMMMMMMMTTTTTTTIMMITRTVMTVFVEKMILFFFYLPRRTISPTERYISLRALTLFPMALPNSCLFGLSFYAYTKVTWGITSTLRTSSSPGATSGPLTGWLRDPEEGQATRGFQDQSDWGARYAAPGATHNVRVSLLYILTRV